MSKTENSISDNTSKSQKQALLPSTASATVNSEVMNTESLINQGWTSVLFVSVIVVVSTTSLVMGVNIGGPNLYNGFIIPWSRGHPFPCQKEGSTSQWIANKWWNCTYDDSNKTMSSNYYLPEVPRSKLVGQRILDGLNHVLFVIGGFIGAYTGQYWYLCLSRRNAIFANFPFQIIASILMIITLYIYYGHDTVEYDKEEDVSRVKKNKDLAISLLYISRFLSGFSAGMCCVVSTSYLNDISPRALRGTVGSFHQLAIVVGILIGQIIGLPWILGRHNTWNWGMAWVGLFPLVGCILIWFLPESPRWLVEKNKMNDAAEILRNLRHSNDIETELHEIEVEEKSRNQKDISIFAVVFSKNFRWPLITSLALNGIQQLSGINAVFFYSSDMFAVAGLREEKVFWGILATGAINLLATLIALKLIEVLGRRPLIIWPLAMITVIMIALTILIVINGNKSEENKETLAMLSIVLILIFIVLFAVGLGPIPYVYSNEVFSVEARAAGLSLAMFINWFCNFLVTLFFLPLQSMIGGFVFLVFCGFVSIAFTLLYFKMPETKNKILLEIQGFWQ